MWIETSLNVFENEQFGKVRTVMKNGQPYFIAADVCKCLEIADVSAATARLDFDELVRVKIVSGGQTRELNAVSEAGIYSLVLGSRKPEAKQFKRWVTHDIIPSIRKNGGYIANQENLTPELIVANALVVANNIIENQKLALEERDKLIEEQRPHVTFSETVQKSTDNILIRDLAKLMCNDGVVIGEKRLFSLLRSFGVLMRDNSPYQTYIDRGYFKVKECTYNTPDGSVKLSNTTLVTPKGQVWLVDKTKQLIGQERIS
jgi:anti-repressor protein